MTNTFEYENQLRRTWMERNLMSTDPLAVLDSPRIEAEEPLPFTDVSGLIDEDETYALEGLPNPSAEKAAMLQLVRCESCEQLYRTDSKGLQEARGFRGLRHREPMGRLLLICGDCVSDINRRSDISTPAWRYSEPPTVASMPMTRIPYNGTLNWDNTTVSPYWDNTTVSPYSGINSTYTSPN